jgi:hypothetical protein
MTSDAAASAAAGRSPVAELLQVPAVPQGGDGRPFRTGGAQVRRCDGRDDVRRLRGGA